MNGPAAPDRWLTVAEAAEYLAVGRRTLYRLVEHRRIPFRRLPGTGTVRFAPEDIAAIEQAAAAPPLR